MKCSKRRSEPDEIPDIMRLIDTIKTVEKLPTPGDDFEKHVMVKINENKTGFFLRRPIYVIVTVLSFAIIGAMVFRYTRPAENSYIIPLQDVKTLAEAKKKSPIKIRDTGTQNLQLSKSQNRKSRKQQPKSPQRELDLGVSYDVKAHIGMELVEVLDETIKAIERGDQEWEIEI